MRFSIVFYFNFYFSWKNRKILLKIKNCKGQVDIEKIEDENELCSVLTQLANYGQTPHQLFALKHPEKNYFKKEKSVFLLEDVKFHSFF